MSQKIDANGTLLGSYTKDELQPYWWPEKYREGRRRRRLKMLDYDFIWNITEMQVKVHIRPIFPNPPGPLTTQLAKECHFESHETIHAGESRSKALEKDIVISRAAPSKPGTVLLQPLEEAAGALFDCHEPSMEPLIDGPAELSSTPTSFSGGEIVHLGPQNMNKLVQVSCLNAADHI